MVLNRQRRVRVSPRPLEEFLARVRRLLRLPDDSVAVCLVTDAAISRWNRSYRGKRGATDVLSFPARPGAALRSTLRHRPRRSRMAARPGDPEGYLGDIAIAPHVARRNARRMHRPFALELRILILHGVLHLLGYDHETDGGQMARLELRLRRRLELQP
jgi:probable rRNA maturation factor